MIPEHYIAQLNSILYCQDKQEREVLLCILCRDKNFIKLLKMVCRNTLNESVPLTKQQKHEIKNYAAVIDAISKTSDPKKEVLQNGSGFLSLLIPIVTSLIGSAINDANK